MKIILRLKRFGYPAYLVGGCVRDLLLGSIPKDFDIATSARPRQIRKVFRNSKIIGRRFKLVHVIFSDKIIEVSTFRKAPVSPNYSSKNGDLLIKRDNVYGSHRDDALRRDFSVNSLYYDIENEEVIDFAGGVRDIQQRILRTIGDPHIRLQEDPVRILRAVRFSCRLGLEIDDSLLTTMKQHAPDISKSAAQRVTEEIIRLMACGASHKALQLMLDLGLFNILLPELYESLDTSCGFYGSEVRGRDLLLRLSKVMDQADRGKRRFANPLFLAVLFSPLCGMIMDDLLERDEGPHDPGIKLNSHLRPIALRMGISRWEQSNLKQIVIALMRLNASRKRRRSKTNEFVRRSYFPDALEFYRQILTALQLNQERYRWWRDKREQTIEGPGVKDQSLGSRRRKRRRKPPPKPKNDVT
ncbi:MAG: polynucleotide adenylyltransferase PcnB [Planctomycetes bacterium]|nr:polynucleotide adenylyltransferase PcnB [Planctomycetota bacterium]